jgi:hypothetical protein
MIRRFASDDRPCRGRRIAILLWKKFLGYRLKILPWRISRGQEKGAIVQEIIFRKIIDKNATAVNHREED